MAKKVSNLFITIKNAKNSGILKEPFRVKDVNAACNGLLAKSPSIMKPIYCRVKILPGC